MGNFKAFAAGVVATVVALQCGTFAYGKWMEEKISVIYQNIQVTVDDKELITTNEPFIYNGTTYLPVHDVAEAVGKKVSWDNEKKIVRLYDSDVVESTKPDQKETSSQDCFTVSNLKTDYFAGTYRVYGEITNHYDRDFEFVAFKLNFYNGTSLKGTGNGIVMNMSAGETKVFEIYIQDNISGATRYELQMESALNYDEL
ncbi:stalk domain-containing protein [Anaerotignum lactatifermentans]|jgi:hypothetical protein|uniref:Copper amine oxidase N-terminal domain-containing protein n=1 Tax=Anaerotignum lactatifermentans DSM 14214 TaxID=1121323 RepID=A0A1M6R905_9FIRM|nr:stalk domain-containing protein [Anaerotignum lactatifermentans]SHK28955.1 Copper amine oxidase N-terminal domain-containing protein [[Clostridium] lactatifermentans DSM 14214] [Anaerotignum lactatifermentans DSM 14214]